MFLCFILIINIGLIACNNKQSDFLGQRDHSHHSHHHQVITRVSDEIVLIFIGCVLLVIIALYVFDSLVEIPQSSRIPNIWKQQNRINQLLEQQNRKLKVEIEGVQN